LLVESSIAPGFPTLPPQVLVTYQVRVEVPPTAPVVVEPAAPEVKDAAVETDKAPSRGGYQWVV
jgi:hypothetical protein